MRIHARLPCFCSLGRRGQISVWWGGLRGRRGRILRCRMYFSPILFKRHYNQLGPVVLNDNDFPPLLLNNFFYFLKIHGLSSFTLNNFLRDIRRHFFIPFKLHSKGSAAFSQGTKVRGVTKHFSQRNLCFNNL